MATSDDLRPRVEKVLQVFLQEAIGPLAHIDPDLPAFGAAIEAFVLDGGKRLRPAFCYWGHRAAGGPDSEDIIRVAASLELLHACALVHDDVIDRSDTRRGAPSVHRRFADVHRSHRWQGDPDAFGQAAAILLGDLALVWADTMISTSGFSPDALGRAEPVWDAMRVEVMCGQYLDVVEQARGGGSVQRALQVAQYKSAKYTVERPLHLGAALAGAGPDLATALTSYGLPLGEAFQLRDDLLGVYGDPAATGKPAGDDLREGKRTVLIALAVEAATPGQAEAIRCGLGDPALDDAAVTGLRDAIRETSAPDRVESMIGERVERALAALSGAQVPDDARAALTRLVDAATQRSV